MRGIGRKLAMVLLGALAGLAAGEGLVRAFGPEIQVVFRDQIVASDDPMLRYTLRPGARDRDEVISSAGLRDREYAVPKPAGVVRIAVVGDSIAFGFGNPRAAGWTKRLEALLGARAPGSHVEVINLGVPGYNIEQVVARLRVVGLGFEPDAVIYGYSLNDPQDVSIETEALDTLRTAFEEKARAGVGRWLVHSRLYLLARSIGFERMKQQALRADPPRDPAFEAAQAGDRTRYFRTLHREGESAERLRRGLDALQSLAQEHGLPVLVLLFPLFGDENGEGPEALADVHAALAAAATARGFAVLDLLPAYTAATESLGAGLSIDFMHPNPLGHRVAALAALDWICASAWPPPHAIECSGAASLDATDAAVARAIADGGRAGASAP